MQRFGRLFMTREERAFDDRRQQILEDVSRANSAPAVRDAMAAELAPCTGRPGRRPVPDGLEVELNCVRARPQWCGHELILSSARPGCFLTIAQAGGRFAGLAARDRMGPGDLLVCMAVSHDRLGFSTHLTRISEAAAVGFGFDEESFSYATDSSERAAIEKAVAIGAALRRKFRIGSGIVLNL